MAIVTGKGTVLQIGQETTWGEAATASVALNYLSESFTFTPERKEEETLNGGKTARSLDIMKKSVESSSFELIAKPENIGLILGLALGEEADAEAVSGYDGAYQHDFTLIEAGSSTSLPSFTAIVDRIIAKKAYVGLKVESIEFKVDAGDYMHITVTCSGKDEKAGTTVSTLTVPSKKAFRFAGGSCTFDGTEFGNITSVTITVNNNLDDGEQTLGSGYYGTEKQPQTREVTLSFETFYDADSETVRENKYKEEATCAVVLSFVSPDEVVDGCPYSIKFNMPLVTVNDCSPNVSDAGKIPLTIGGTCLESSSQEAITVSIVDGQSTKYLA